jgi:hypothetical protein
MWLVTFSPLLCRELVEELLFSDDCTLCPLAFIEGYEYIVFIGLF